MASPKIEVLFVFDAATGAPKTGLTLSFSTYKDDAGTNVSQPSISEIGGGAYKFTPVFADPTHGIVYVISTGQNPAYLTRYMRPEDWNADNADTASSTLATASALSTASTNVSTVLAHVTADERVHTSGGDANRVVRYNSSDHTTVLQKWDLLDEDGTTPVSDNAYYRKKV